MGDAEEQFCPTRAASMDWPGEKSNVVIIWIAMRFAAVFVATMAFAWTSAAQDSGVRASPNHDPDAARFVTSDLDNFWRAYALAVAAGSATEREKIYQREYLDKGSPGLKDF